jgi:methylated-DNA-protein-cysteine methyltransferase-like protein
MSRTPPSQSQKSDAYHQFRLQVYSIVRTIPAGKVMTYGAIAALIPYPEMCDPMAYSRIRARWVGYALKSCPEDVPWWRVVNAEGRISLRMGHGPYIQPILLEEEGLQMEGGKIVHLSQVLWNPESDQNH